MIRAIAVTLMLAVGTVAFIVTMPHSVRSTHVKPYSYSVTYHGMRCTMDVDSSGNGSLNNCER